MNKLLVLSFCLLGLAACEERKASVVSEVIPPVLVREVTMAPLASERRLPGTVKPRIESDLGFRVTGKLTRRLVDAGQVVTAGQVLGELDQEDLALQLAQAEADLAAARSARETAAAELERTSTLRRAGWSTAAEHDRQRTAVEEAAGRAARAEHTVSLARNALEHASLRSDASGVITAVLAEPGQVLAAGQPAFRLAHLDRLEVEVAVPEIMLELARSAAAEASLWALPGRSLSAQLRELSPRADPATRTYPARFSLPAEAPGVTLGMTATITLREQSGIAAGKVGALLPLAAIHDEGKGPNVYVVDQAAGTVARRPVQLLRFGTEHVVVIDGLNGGEMVVQLGVQKLVPGQRVRPLTRLPS